MSFVMDVAVHYCYFTGPSAPGQRRGLRDTGPSPCDIPVERSEPGRTRIGNWDFRGPRIAASKPGTAGFRKRWACCLRNAIRTKSFACSAAVRASGDHYRDAVRFRAGGRPAGANMRNISLVVSVRSASPCTTGIARMSRLSPAASKIECMRRTKVLRKANHIQEFRTFLQPDSGKRIQ